MGHESSVFDHLANQTFQIPIKESDFQGLFEAVPGLYLVLLPNPPTFTIVAASDAYLQQTMTSRANLLGKGIFEAFPASPLEPEAKDVIENLKRSLLRVLNEKKTDSLAIQKYSIRQSPYNNGTYVERYWSLINAPVINSLGRVTFIIHRADDVTGLFLLEHREFEDSLQSEKVKSSQRKQKKSNWWCIQSRDCSQLYKFFLPSPNESRFKRLLRHSIPSLIVGMALLAQYDLARYLGIIGSFILYPALFIASLIGGVISNFFALAIGITGTWFFLLSQFGTLQLAHPENLISLSVMVFSGLIFCAFSLLLRSIREKELKSINQLEKTSALLLQANQRLAHREKERNQLFEKQKKLDHLKNQLLSNVSHELRTPLTLILGPLQRLLSGPIPLEMHSALKRVQKNALMLLQTVDDLLEVSRLELGKSSMVYSEVDLSELIRQMANPLYALAKKKEIQFFIDIPQSLLINTDVEKVTRILRHVLSNAFKFTPNGGKIRLKMLEETSLSQSSKKIILLQVLNTGNAVPEEYRNAIFDPFFQIDESSIRRFGGSGVGLAIVKNLIELLGGRVFLDSNSQDGTSLSLEIPRHSPPGAALKDSIANLDSHLPYINLDSLELASHPIASIHSDSPRHRPLVLVVEDSSEMNHFLCEILTPDYETASAHNGKEGLAKSESLHPDLIISDIMMPEMSGDQMFRALRARDELKDIPIILLTAKTDEELRLRLLREGVEDYLTKPFLVEELRVRARNLINTRLAHREVAKELYARQLAEEKYVALAQTAQDAIILINDKGEIEFANSQTLKLFGYNKEELIGQDIEILVPNVHRHKHRRLRREFMIGHKMGTQKAEAPRSMCALRRDGLIFPVDVTLTALSGQNGVHVTAIVRDMSEYRKRETQLKLLSNAGQIFAESIEFETTLEKVTRYITNGVADGCIVRLFSEEGRLEVASVSHRNPEKEVMLKKISQAFSQLENPHPRLDEVIHLRKAIYGGAVGKESLQELGLGEETLNHLLQLNLSSYVVVPLVARDKVLGIMNFISDESKIIFDSSDASFHQDIGRLAALCLENSKLYDEANREVTIRENVLGIVSHDLKNPISVIKLSAQLLKELESSPQSSLPGNIMTVSERIQNATDQMLHLIDGVLDLARIQSGKMVIEVKPHKLSDIVDPILSLLSTNAQQKGITLKRNFPPELPLIYCDKISMNQVLLNLVGNAIKFTPEGGKVTISALDLHDSIEIQVTDNGTGIPKEQLARIFDRFWQGDKDADLGVGLGLSIVKSLVTAHHGRVWVDSVLGHGSCFHVNLPLNLQSDLPTNIQPKAEFSTTQISRSSNTALGGTRILLIDDSPELLMLMKLMLQNVGAEVVATESPSEALNYLRQGQHFDILLTDIEMPEFNGFDLIHSLKQLRNDFPLAKIPVAAITAHHRKECLDHIVASGFDDYVLKPINQKEMILTIQKLLRHYRPRSIGDPQVHLPVSESISPM